MIMVGPGTGVAPFRAFLEERRELGATGKNWLFFGERNRASDFFYAEQLFGYYKDGFLTHLDLAFSRDQRDKCYVQHRMLENSQELYTWLEEGAYFFVCGDMQRMARDVDAALHQVIEQASGCSAEDAAVYVTRLKQTKRYVRDVY
jgi:sulfite reductase (NADPH) flavoprotein alpha-component